MATVDLDLPTLRTSERAAAKRCVWRWWQEYRMGWQPRFKQADALWFGIGIHQALAEWYLKGKKRGPHPAETFEAWCGDEIAYARSYLDDNFEEPVWYEAKDLGVAMLEGYVDYWGKDSQWSIISTEQPFAVTITSHGRPVAIFRSRWDGVFRDLRTGKVYLLETKTAQSVDTAYLELDDQAGAYWAVASFLLRKAGVLKKDEEIEGIQYNFLRKKMPDERPVNADGLATNTPTKEHYVAAILAAGIRTVEQSAPKSGPIPVEKAKLADLQTAARFGQIEVLGDVSKNQPTPLFERPEPILRSAKECATQLQRIADEVEVMNAYRDGTLPLIKTPNKDCPRCPLWGPCRLHERGSDSYLSLLESNYIQVDPYKDDLKSASGYA